MVRLLWRTRNGIDGHGLAAIAAVRAKTRTGVWALAAQRHGGIPPARVGSGIRRPLTGVDAIDADRLRTGRYLSGWPPDLR